MKVICELNMKSLSVHIFRNDKKVGFFVTEIKELDDRNLKNLIYEKFVNNITPDLTKIKKIALKLLFGSRFCYQKLLSNDNLIEEIRQDIRKYPFYIPMAESVANVFVDIFSPEKIKFFNETDFFEKLPEEEKVYPISGCDNSFFPEKKGFHGIYHEYNGVFLGKNKRVVSVVLEDLSTVAGINEGHPTMVSLGNSPTEGIMGKNSCGDIDPGIVFHLMRETGLDIYDIDAVLKKKSGFFGVTGFSEPIADLYQYVANDKKVQLAFKIFKMHLMKYMGHAIATMHGVDKIVFAGSSLEPLIPFVYRLLKDISFLGIHTKILPWEISPMVKVSTERSAIDVVLNFLDTSEIICTKMNI